jgi:hypothetical protein
MVSSMMRRIAALAAALALAITVPAATANAVAEAVCTVDYDLSSPAGYAESNGHTFVGGLSTVNRTVVLERTDCATLPDSTAWKVTGPGFVASGTLSNLVDTTVAVTPPTSNRAAGLRVNRVVIEITPVPTVEVPVPVTETFFRDIRLKRRVIATKTDAAPEPVRSGTVITIASRFSVADWSDQDYVALTGRNVRLQARTHPGVYDDNQVIDTDATNSRGVARLSVAATSTRVWRFDFKGSATLGHVHAVGDLVRVR